MWRAPSGRGNSRCWCVPCRPATHHALLGHQLQHQTDSSRRRFTCFTDPVAVPGERLCHQLFFAHLSELLFPFYAHSLVGKLTGGRHIVSSLSRNWCLWRVRWIQYLKCVIVFFRSSRCTFYFQSQTNRAPKLRKRSASQWKFATDKKTHLHCRRLQGRRGSKWEGGLIRPLPISENNAGKLSFLVPTLSKLVFDNWSIGEIMPVSNTF